MCGTTLALRDKSHLIVVYDSSNVLLDLVYWYFIEDFYTYVLLEYWPRVFFVVSLFDCGIQKNLNQNPEEILTLSCSV